MIIGNSGSAPDVLHPDPKQPERYKSAKMRGLLVVFPPSKPKCAQIIPGRKLGKLSASRFFSLHLQGEGRSERNSKKIEGEKRVLALVPNR